MLLYKSAKCRWKALFKRTVRRIATDLAVFDIVISWYTKNLAQKKGE